MIEKADRNKQVVEDKKTMSWSQMVAKYKMAQSTLQKIVKRTVKKYEVINSK